jgi:hypothetical protein
MNSLPIPNIVGTGVIDQLIQSVIIVLFLYVFLSILNNLGILYFTWLEMNTTLQPDTSTATETYIQEPNLETSKTCYPSKNEASGTEFTYTCFLNFRSTNFGKDSNLLRHVFHKGSPPPDAYPLVSPGVFTVSDKNTIRVYMGSADRWDNFVDIPNIPVEKWFHLVLVCKGRNLDVYINGNVIQRLTLSSVPKLNFGDVYVFQNVTNEDNRVSVGPEHRFNVDGKADGMISRFQYYAYGLSYSEIDNLYRQGPSSKIVSSSNQLPPYLADAWWVQHM